MTLEEVLKKHKDSFHPVVPMDVRRDKILWLDLTAANKALTPALLADTTAFSYYVQQEMQTAGATLATGGYNELRVIYDYSDVFAPVPPQTERRRLHLGVDIWCRPYLPVYAPCDGIVHSFAFNNRKGDYGSTILLTHLLDGISFYTLYGHLSLNSIKDLQEGQRITKGEVIGEAGIPSENGGWPPHLHFQLIREIGNYNGDYPGVCAPGEKDKWLFNSPDPEWMLQLHEYQKA